MNQCCTRMHFVAWQKKQTNKQFVYSPLSAPLVSHVYFIFHRFRWVPRAPTPVVWTWRERRRGRRVRPRCPPSWPPCSRASRSWTRSRSSGWGLTLGRSRATTAEPPSVAHTHTHTHWPLFQMKFCSRTLEQGLLGENHPWLSEQGRMGAEWNNKADPHSESRVMKCMVRGREQCLLWGTLGHWPLTQNPPQWN